MNYEKEISSSDTLATSNIASLQSDDISTKKDSESISKNTNLDEIEKCLCQNQTLGYFQYIPCPATHSDVKKPQYGHQCVCQQFQLGEFYPHKQNVNESEKKKPHRFCLKWPRQSYTSKKDKSYESKAKNRPYFRKPLACCAMEGIPRTKTSGCKNPIASPTKHSIINNDDIDKQEKIEIYYFDHGNSAYYHTTDLPPVVATEQMAEKVNLDSVKFWAEIFGFLHIITTFLTAFMLQLFRYLLFSLLRPLTVGVVQLLADYFMKPLLSITFNGIIQPVLILFYNMATSLRDCCEPLATAVGFYIREVAVLFRAFRLIEINYGDRGNIDT